VTANALYDERYAAHYRAADEAMSSDPGFAQFSPWLGRLSRSFGRRIDVLDLGCGTGRYFASLGSVRELVGLDASQAMLDRARTPIDAGRIGAERITLVRGDVASQAFEPSRFDLIYSVGVLAEHVALTSSLVSRITSWLAPGGALAFSAVHPDSPTVAQTWKRRLGRAAMPLSIGPLRGWLRDRWCSHGLYADESWIRDVLAPSGLAIESLSRIQTVHLHCLVVARKSA